LCHWCRPTGATKKGCPEVRLRTAPLLCSSEPARRSTVPAARFYLLISSLQS
jgi:hypothetical protein